MIIYIVFINKVALRLLEHVYYNTDRDNRLVMKYIKEELEYDFNTDKTLGDWSFESPIKGEGDDKEKDLKDAAERGSSISDIGSSVNSQVLLGSVGAASYGEIPGAAGGGKSTEKRKSFELCESLARIIENGCSRTASHSGFLLTPDAAANLGLQHQEKVLKKGYNNFYNLLYILVF